MPERTRLRLEEVGFCTESFVKEMALVIVTGALHAAAPPSAENPALWAHRAPQSALASGFSAAFGDAFVRQANTLQHMFSDESLGVGGSRGDGEPGEFGKLRAKQIRNRLRVGLICHTFSL